MYSQEDLHTLQWVFTTSFASTGVKFWPEGFFNFRFSQTDAWTMSPEPLAATTDCTQVSNRYAFLKGSFWFTCSLSPENMLVHGNILPNPQLKLCVTSYRSITNSIIFLVYLSNMVLSSYTFQLIWCQNRQHKRLKIIKGDRLLDMEIEITVFLMFSDINDAFPPIHEFYSHLGKMSIQIITSKEQYGFIIQDAYK